MKYRFILTRDITESAVVVVEGDNEDAAADKALEKVFAGDCTWEVDDNTPGAPYFTDTEELKEN